MRAHSRRPHTRTLWCAILLNGRNSRFDGKDWFVSSGGSSPRKATSRTPSLRSAALQNVAPRAAAARGAVLRTAAPRSAAPRTAARRIAVKHAAALRAAAVPRKCYFAHCLRLCSAHQNDPYLAK